MNQESFYALRKFSKEIQNIKEIHFWSDVSMYTFYCLPLCRKADILWPHSYSVSATEDTDSLAFTGTVEDKWVIREEWRQRRGICHWWRLSSETSLKKQRSEQRIVREQNKKKPQKQYDCKFLLVFPAGLRSEQLTAIWVHLANLGTAPGL